MNELRSKYVEQAVKNKRIEKNLNATDFLTTFQSIGALPEKRYRLMRDALDSAFNSYRKNLLMQGKALIASTGYTGDKFKDDFLKCKLNKYDDFLRNPDLINLDFIELEYKQGNLNNLDSLILHHVRLLNQFKLTLEATQGGVFGIEALVQYLVLFDEIEKFSKYAVEVGQQDPISFRQYTLFAHIAYTGFASDLWYKLVENKNIDRTVKELAEKIAMTFKPDDSGKIGVDLTHDDVQEVKNSLWEDCHKFFLKHTNQVEKISGNLALRILPSLIGVHNDNDNENRFKVTLFELMEQYPNINPDVNIYIYLNATYPYSQVSDVVVREKGINSEEILDKLREKQKDCKSITEKLQITEEKLKNLDNQIVKYKQQLEFAKDFENGFGSGDFDTIQRHIDELEFIRKRVEHEIERFRNDYRDAWQTVGYIETKLRLDKFCIDAVKLIKKKESISEENVIDIKALAIERNNIIKVIQEIEVLLEQELYLDQFLSKDQHKRLAELSPKVADELRNQLKSFLLGFDSIDKNIKDHVERFLENLDIDSKAKPLAKAALQALASNNNPKIEYYQGLIQKLKRKLVYIDNSVYKGVDGEIINHVNNLNVLAERYKAISYDPVTILRKGDPEHLDDSGDHFTVFGGLFNPTEFAVTDRMPLFLRDRLVKIKAIDKVIEFLITEFEKQQYLSLSENDYDDSVRKAYGRLKKNIKALKQARDSLIQVNLSLTLDQLYDRANDIIIERDQENAALEKQSAGFKGLFQSAQSKMDTSKRTELRIQYESDLQILKEKVFAIREMIKNRSDESDICVAVNELNNMLINLNARSYNFDYLQDELRLLSGFISAPSEMSMSDLSDNVLNRQVGFKNNTSWQVSRANQFLAILRFMKGFGQAVKFAYNLSCNITSFIPGSIIRILSNKFIKQNRDFLEDTELMLSDLEKVLKSDESKVLLDDLKKFKRLRILLGSKLSLQNLDFKSPHFIKFKQLESKLKESENARKLELLSELMRVRDDLNNIRSNIGRFRPTIKFSLFKKNIIRYYNPYSYENLVFNKYTNLKQRYFSQTDKGYVDARLVPKGLANLPYSELVKDYKSYTTKVNAHLDEYETTKGFIESIELVDRQHLIRLFKEGVESIESAQQKKSPTASVSDGRLSPLAREQSQDSRLEQVLKLVEDSNDESISFKLQQSCYKHFAEFLCVQLLQIKRQAMLDLLESPRLDYVTHSQFINNEFNHLSVYVTTSLSDILNKNDDDITKDDIELIQQVDKCCTNVEQSIKCKIGHAPSYAERFFKPLVFRTLSHFSSSQCATGDHPHADIFGAAKDAATRAAKEVVSQAVKDAAIAAPKAAFSSVTGFVGSLFKRKNTIPAQQELDTDTTADLRSGDSSDELVMRI